MTRLNTVRLDAQDYTLQILLQELAKQAVHLTILLTQSVLQTIHVFNSVLHHISHKILPLLVLDNALYSMNLVLHALAKLIVPNLTSNIMELFQMIAELIALHCLLIARSDNVYQNATHQIMQIH